MRVVVNHVSLISNVQLLAVTDLLAMAVTELIKDVTIAGLREMEPFPPIVTVGTQRPR